MVTLAKTVISSYEAPGQPSVVSVSGCVAGIECASVKLRAVLLYLWILNSVSAISCGDVIGVRSMQTLIN